MIPVEFSLEDGEEIQIAEAPEAYSRIEYSVVSDTQSIGNVRVFWKNHAGDSRGGNQISPGNRVSFLNVTDAQGTLWLKAIGGKASGVYEFEAEAPQPLKDYCKPIPYEGCQTCTVEFTDTPGGVFTAWRIKSEDGQVRTGLCEEGANAGVYYKDPEYGDYDLKAADLNDCRAIKATWPSWEAMRARDPGQEQRDREVAEMHEAWKFYRGVQIKPDPDLS
jgi:hypothetical protein